MFSTHKLNEKGFEEVKEFKNAMARAAMSAVNLMPESREKSLFLTKLDEAVFFGTKAVASKPGNFSDITEYPDT